MASFVWRPSWLLFNQFSGSGWNRAHWLEPSRRFGYGWLSLKIGALKGTRDVIRFMLMLSNFFHNEACVALANLEMKHRQKSDSSHELVAVTESACLLISYLKYIKPFPQKHDVCVYGVCCLILTETTHEFEHRCPIKGTVHEITPARLWIDQTERFGQRANGGQVNAWRRERDMTSGTMLGMPPSNGMTMKRRALLVGCNYPDYSADGFNLDGCWNDVARMRERLISRFGFERDCICELVDRPGTDPKFVATGANIREMLHHSLRDLESGDSVVFHFSGHGVRVKYSGGFSVQSFLRICGDLIDCRWASAIGFSGDVDVVMLFFILRWKCVWMDLVCGEFCFIVDSSRDWPNRRPRVEWPVETPPFREGEFFLHHFWCFQQVDEFQCHKKEEELWALRGIHWYHNLCVYEKRFTL